MVRKLVVVFTSVVLFAAAHVKALGLGEIVVESALNQPLAARIDLLQLGGVRPEQINVQLASESDFARFSIDRESFLDSIRFNVETAGNSAFVRLSTVGAVREPYLSFVLETSWPSGRLLSEHTVLLDLPPFAANTQAAPIQQAVQNQPQPSSQNTSDNQVVANQSSAPASSSPARLAAPAEPASAADPAPQDAAPQDQGSQDTASQDAGSSQSVEQPAQTPLAATTDTVSIGADDTLWDIALQVRPDSSVTVQQTMLALQRLNSEAFIADNINMVRRGQVLRVPDIEQIRALSAREAVSEVARQNQLFENRSNVPLTAQPVAAQPSPAPADSAAGRGELRVVTTDPADATDAQSTSGGRSAELEARIASLENELAVQQEEADRVALQNRELTDRLGLLEQQIASAQEIIRLRDLELAQLQQTLAQAEQEVTPEDPPTVITMAPERSFLQTVLDTLIANTYALLAVTALVILMLVYVLLRRNKTEEDEALADMEAMGETPGSIASAGSHAEFASGQVAASRATSSDDELDEIFGLADEADEVMSEEGFASSTDADDLSDVLESDVLEEAEALIAHRHFDEAAVLLQDAIQADPDNTELRLKLLEVYAARQDKAGFSLQEAALLSLGGAAVAARVAELRSQLPDETDDEVLEEVEDDFFGELSASEEIAGEDADQESAVDIDVDTLESAATTEHEQVIDFDFALSEPAPLSDEPQAADEDVSDDSDDADDNLLDFDFNFAADESEAAVTEEELVEVDAPEEDPGHSIDFDFTVLEDANTPPASPSSEIAQDDDIEFDIDEEDNPLATIDVEEGEFSFDSSEFDLDAVDKDEPRTNDAPIEDDFADLRFVDDEMLEEAQESNAEDAAEDDEFEFLSDTDEAATKLDLAQAYYEMGDYEGAREILEEVIEEGTEAQIKDARDLLGKL